MNATLRKPTVAAALVAGLLLAACQDTGMKPLADKRINGFFARADVPRLKGNLVDQICQATGGPCVYKGKDMMTAHKGMGISDADFAALVEDLVKTLDKFNVPAKEKGELLNVLGPLKPQIVKL